MPTYREALPGLSVMWTGIVDGVERAIIEDGQMLWDTDYRAYRDKLAEQVQASDPADVYAEFCDGLPYHGGERPNLHYAIVDAYNAETGEDISGWAWS